MSGLHCTSMRYTISHFFQIAHQFSIFFNTIVAFLQNTAQKLLFMWHSLHPLHSIFSSPPLSQHELPSNLSNMLFESSLWHNFYVLVQLFKKIHRPLPSKTLDPLHLYFNNSQIVEPLLHLTFHFLIFLFVVLFLSPFLSFIPVIWKTILFLLASHSIAIHWTCSTFKRMCSILQNKITQTKISHQRTITSPLIKS